MNKRIETASVLETNLPKSAAAEGVEGLLAKHPFLEGLNPHQIHLLKDCALEVCFAPGELVFRAGDPANCFYLILKGRVALEAPAGERGSNSVSEVGAAEVLGWSWLVPPHYWHFDARALEFTRAVLLYGPLLREECETDHDLGYELLKRMAGIIVKRLQATRRQLLDRQGTGGQTSAR